MSATLKFYEIYVYDRLSIVEYEMFAFMTLNSSSISQPAFTCSQ